MKSHLPTLARIIADAVRCANAMPNNLRGRFFARKRIGTVTRDTLCGPSRALGLVMIRAAVAKVAHSYSEPTNRMSRYSTPRIAQALGKSDHTTVINLLRQHDAYAREPGFAWLMAALTEAVLRTEPEPPQVSLELVEALSQRLTGVERINREEWIRRQRLGVANHRAARAAARTPDIENPDSSHDFHAEIAKGSRDLLAALREAGGKNAHRDFTLPGAAAM